MAKELVASLLTKIPSYPRHDTVRLKDERTGVVVEVFDDQEVLMDVGSSPEDWETVSVTRDEIESVIQD